MRRYLLILAVVMLLATLILNGCAAPAPAPAPSPSPTAKPSPAPAPAPSPAPKPTLAVSGKPWGGVEFIRFSDSTAGDPAMEMWGLVCNYWSQIPGIKANAFAASSGTQIFQISEGQAEAGVIYGSQIMRYKDIKFLPKGKTKPVTNISAIYTWSCLSGALFVRADSKFKTLDDLKTATIGGNVGEGGFGGTALALLEGAGITIGNIGQTGGKISTMTTAACQDGLRDKTLDVWMYGGTPVLASEAATVLDKEVRLRRINPTKEQLEKAAKLHPEFGIVTLDWSGGSPPKYFEEKGPFQALGDMMIVAVRSDLPNDLVYEMLKQINDTDALEKIRRLGPSHAVRWPENSRVSANIWGEHPGAVKYFEERKIPINDKFIVKTQ